MNLLSIQSSVCYGHVGNSAAELPLRLLGFQVWRVDTTHFSNQPGHGRHCGRVVPATEIEALLTGLNDLGLAARTDAVLSGYLGEPDTGHVVAAHIRALRPQKPDLLYLLDPVMGDSDGGVGRLYVNAGIPTIMREELLPLADIVTPNRFELEVLTGRPAGSMADLVEAARSLLQSGPKLILVTSVDSSDTPEDCIDTVAVTADGVWRTRQSRFARRFDGAGDLLTALFLGYLLQAREVPDALSRAVSSLLPVLQATDAGGGTDLALTEAVSAMLNPPIAFIAKRLA
jgi:pyridoxine kinase